MRASNQIPSANRLSRGASTETGGEVMLSAQPIHARLRLPLRDVRAAIGVQRPPRLGGQPFSAGARHG